MFKRKFNSVNADISMLGFGCMRLPIIGEDRSAIDYEKAQEMVDYAYENGVNYFDTAYPYHLEKSELFIGQALKKYPRDSFYLANKLPTWLLKSEEDVSKYLDEQLKKCQVDYFDFYLVHSLDQGRQELIRKFNVVEILRQKQKEGKIKYLGFSFHDKPPVLQSLLDEYEWDFCQLQVNYLDWELQDSKSQYEMVQEKGIPCIVMEPVRGGALATLSKEAGEVLKKAKPDKSLASWAVRYVATLPNVITVLSGMTTMEHVIDNVDTLADFEPISEEEQKTIDKALEIYKSANAVPCTACRYCMPCPFGVDIPGVLAIYNEFLLGKNELQFHNAYSDLPEGSQGKNCVTCGKCLPECPQHIEIPKRVQEAHEAFTKLPF